MIAERQTRTQNLDLALIGNSSTAAFVDHNARIVWWCFPRFDSDPVFARLLAGDEEKGFCDVVLAGLVETQSDYLRNTAIVETVLTDAEGGKLRVTDFAPRFERFERAFRPPQIIRRIEPIAGLPRITLRVRPTHDYGRPTTNAVVGSNHVRYVGGAQVMRLTTDAPISYIVSEISFPLTRPISLIFGQDDPFLSAIDATSREFLDRTCDHWLDWSRNLAVPFEWQSVVIRSAITLKLSSFDGNRRDHRRAYDLHPGGAFIDAQLGLPVLLAEGRLFRRRRAQPAGRNADDGILHPLHHDHRRHQPQNDAAGARHRAVLLARGDVCAGPEGLSRPWSSPRRQSGGVANAERCVWQRRARSDADVRRRAPDENGRRVAVSACSSARASARSRSPSNPTRDSGNIEPAPGRIRIRQRCAGRPATGSAGLRTGSISATAPSTGATARRRLARTHSQGSLGRKAGRADWGFRRARARRERAARIRTRPSAADRPALHQDVRDDRARTHAQRAASCATPLPTISARRRPRFSRATSGTWTRSVRSGGRPRRADLFEAILASRNAYGLLSEDIHPETGELWGNLPQTYSMAGIINTATRLSSSWEDAWAHV